MSEEKRLIDANAFLKDILTAGIGKTIERYGHMECIHGVSYRNTWNKPDFFCSYGERKEGVD